MYFVDSSTYYARSEVSNSDLTSLKNLLHPRSISEEVIQMAFKMGTLVDALVTEPDSANRYARTVGKYKYTEEEFRHGEEMYKALRVMARQDAFLRRVLQDAATQCSMVCDSQRFTYGGFGFSLPVRCKWDWYFNGYGFGGDLKTTNTSSQREFEEAFDFLDIDRSRAWYMDIAGSDKDFVYAVSKKNCKVFKIFMERGDERYNRGREKYEELAFKWWSLM